MAFREVIGHRRLLGLLAQAIARQSLTPSLILSGPEGVGKKLTAISIAQELNCLSRTPWGVMRDREHPASASGGVNEAGSACGTCNVCRRIVRGAHPDVMTIEPGESGSIKIEQVRAAIDAAVFRPFEGRRRVTIIEQADALVGAAQNALLKTLEEPLPASVFVLVTSRPDMLLPTVRSRCAHLRFGRLQVADVATILEQREAYSRADALAAAAASGGSVRRALDLEAEEFVEARSDAEDLLKVAGRDPRTRLEQAKALLKGGGSAASEREHLGARLLAMTSLLRDAGLVASGADTQLLANIDRRPSVDSLARALGADRAGRIFTAVTRAEEALDRNVSPKVVADWLAVQL
jgi:DNA polymerase III subunit delta'